jgi:hypothetical protein
MAAYQETVVTVIVSGFLLYSMNLTPHRKTACPDGGVWRSVLLHEPHTTPEDRGALWW